MLLNGAERRRNYQTTAAKMSSIFSHIPRSASGVHEKAMFMKKI